MAKQTLNNLASYLDQRNKINANFDELYAFDATIIHNFDTHTLHVSKDGNDSTGTGTIENPFLTIATAMASFSDNSETIRYAILVHAGVYDEANPLTIKSYVVLQGIGDVRLTPATSVNSDMINMEDFSTVENISVANVTGAYAFNVTNNAMIIRDIVIINCLNGICMNNASGRIDVYNVISLNPVATMTNLYHCLA